MPRPLGVKISQNLPKMFFCLKTNECLKSVRNTRVYRLEEALVPIDRTMELFGHKDIKLFKKYSKWRNENASAKVMHNCRSVNGIGSGKPITYEGALKIELKELEAINVT
jgi:hypothetical protein